MRLTAGFIATLFIVFAAVDSASALQPAGPDPPMIRGMSRRATRLTVRTEADDSKSDIPEGTPMPVVMMPKPMVKRQDETPPATPSGPPKKPCNTPPMVKRDDSTPPAAPSGPTKTRFNHPKVKRQDNTPPAAPSGTTINNPEVKPQDQSTPPATVDNKDAPAGGENPGLAGGIVDQMAKSMKQMIDAWWAVVEAGGQSVTTAEVAQVITDAEKTSDPKDRAASGQAVHVGLLKLAEQKLTEAKSKAGANPPQQNVKRALSPEVIDRVASGIARTLGKFTQAKAEGGPLPTETELAQTFTLALASVDVTDQVAVAVAMRTGLEALANEMLIAAQAGKQS